jgi:hypothetical protein
MPETNEMLSSQIRAMASQALASIDQSFHPRLDLIPELECLVAWSRGFYEGASLGLRRAELDGLAGSGRRALEIAPVDESPDQKADRLRQLRRFFHLASDEPADIGAIRKDLEKFALAAAGR